MAANLTANFGASTSSFSEGVQEIKRQLTSLNTALEQNKQKIADANKEIKENTKRLDELKKATNNGATATAEQAQEMQQLQDAISRTTANLGSLRTTQQELTAQQRNLNRSLQDTQQQANKTAKTSETLKNNLSDLGKEAAVVSGAITAAITALYKFTSDAAKMADDVNTLSTTTGLSTETIQKYTYATNLCDVSLETVTGSIKKLKTAMSTDSKAALFDDLNVKIKDTSGNLRDSESVFYDVIEALSKIPNETERDAKAMELLGKSATELNTLIADGGASFKKVSEDMAKYILPQETLDRLNDFNNKIDTIKARWQGASYQMGAEFVDSFGGAFDTVNGLLDKLEDSIANGDFAKFADELADDLVAVGNAIGTAVKFCWDFKDVIGAAVVSLATFKAAIAIGNIIDATVTSIKSFTKATLAADAAQKTLNATGAANPYVLIASALAAVVGGLITYASQADTAAEKTEKLNKEVADLNDRAEESKKAAESVEALALEYQDLYNNANDNADVKERLKEIQDKLVSTYGTEADQIDLVNGKYADQLGLLQDIAAEKKAQSERDITEAYLKAKESKDKGFSFDLDTGSGYWIDQKQQYTRWLAELNREANYGALNILDSLNSFTLPVGENSKATIAFKAGTDYESMLSVLNNSLNLLEKEYGENVDPALYASINAAIKDIQSAKANYDNAVANYNDLNNPTKNSSNPTYEQNIWNNISKQKHQQEQANQGTTSLTTDEKEDLYDKYLADLDYQRSMDIISDTEYFKNLATLRDAYLEENSDKWKKANIAIHNYQKSLSKSTEKTLGDVAEKESERVVSALDKVEKAYKDTLDAIDKEIEKHDREKEDEEINKKIATVQAKIKYDKIDELTRRELEKELEKLKEEKAELLYDRQMEDRKAAAAESYNIAKDLYNSADDKTKAQIDANYTATLTPPSTSDLTAALNSATAAINRLNDNNTGAISSISNSTNNNTTNNNKNNININISGIDKAIDNLADEIKRAITSQL